MRVKSNCFQPSDLPEITFQPRSKKAKFGKFGGGADLTTSTATFSYKRCEVPRFVAAFGFHKGFSWGLCSGHQIKRKLT